MQMMKQMGSLARGMQVIDVFGGLNAGLRIREGEWSDEKGMSARNYPVLSTRKLRHDNEIIGARCGGMVTVYTPDGVPTVAVVQGNGITFWGGTLDGQHVNMGLTPVSEDDLTEQKQVVAFGAYILIWPDKKYVNVNDLTDKGSVGNEVTVSAFDVNECDEDGNLYTILAVGKTAPANPANGDGWVDISVESENDWRYVLKIYDGKSQTWVTKTDPYVRIHSAAIRGFSAGDVVSVSGLEKLTTPVQNLVADGEHLVQAAGDGYIVVAGIAGRSGIPYEGDGVSLTISRKVPELDYIAVCENRVWGCKYGTVDGKAINEIYASKLGDFKNWSFFQGLATDSYTASRGSDGPFTGAIAYQGHVLFFKENYLEKVYVSAYGAHQIVTTSFQGVQSGCWRSLVIIDDVLYYKSREGICAYNGSVPRCVSRDLGDAPRRWTETACGADGAVLYVHTKRKGQSNAIFTYDTERGIWHMDDDGFLLAGGFVSYDSDLYCGWKKIPLGAGVPASRWYLTRLGGEQEGGGSVNWEIRSGTIGLDLAEQEYISRFVIRFKTDGEIRLYIQYDDSGTWENKGMVEAKTSSGIRSAVIPVHPQRCDTARIMLVGNKECDIYSIGKYVERGSDVAR